MIQCLLGGSACTGINWFRIHNIIGSACTNVIGSACTNTFGSACTTIIGSACSVNKHCMTLVWAFAHTTGQKWCRGQKMQVYTVYTPLAYTNTMATSHQSVHPCNAH